MGNVIIWLLIIELLGLIAFPLAFVTFRGLPDRGITLSKILALLSSSYLLWVLGLTTVIPNSRYTVIGILVIMALVSGFLVWRHGRDIISFIRLEWTYILGGEVLFLAIFFLWLSLAAQVPAINHTEKPMDFGFLNSILQSRYFPPEDMWLAGNSISYYYFGHLMMAFLTKLSGIASSVTYNLSISLTPALVACAAYGLGYNLIRLAGASRGRSMIFALAGPVFVGLIGSLVGVLDFVQARGWGSDNFWQWVSIKTLARSSAETASLFPQDHLWWWHSTRVIDTVVEGKSLDYTITEFPFFSFLLGDMHAHTASLPFLILSLHLALNFLVDHGSSGLTWLWRNRWQALVIALSLGALAFTNAWDFPVFAGLMTGVIFIRGLRNGDGTLSQAAKSTVQIAVPLLVMAVLLFLPFYLSFSSQASGILPLREVSTRPFFLILIWGLFLFISGSLLIRQLWIIPRPTKDDEGILNLTMVVTFLPIVLWAVLVFFLTLLERGLIDAVLTVGARLGKLIPLLMIVGISLYSAMVLAKRGMYPLVFSLLLVALGFYLIMGAELFYVQDFLILRMNTVFKLYYQAWLLLAIASCFGLYWWFSRPLPRRLLLKSGSYLWIMVMVLLFIGSLYYPIGAAWDRVKSSNNPPTLDGLAFVKESNPGEYDAIQELRDGAVWGRLIEAVGRDYSDYGRISSSTGLPSLINWPGHELQWRGTTLLFGNRERDIARIYQSNDVSEVEALLDQYQIRYVYVGRRERTNYGVQGMAKFSQIMNVFFRGGDVVVYERINDKPNEVK